MFVRATMTLDLDVQSPSEAAKLLEPMLAAVPHEVGQFSWKITGQEFFAPRNGKRVSRSRPVYLDKAQTKRIG